MQGGEEKNVFSGAPIFFSLVFGAILCHIPILDTRISVHLFVRV